MYQIELYDSNILVTHEKEPYISDWLITLQYREQKVSSLAACFRSAAAFLKLYLFFFGYTDVLPGVSLFRKLDQKQSRSFSAARPRTGSKRHSGGPTGSRILRAVTTPQRSGDRFSCGAGENTFLKHARFRLKILMSNGRSGMKTRVNETDDVVYCVCSIAHRAAVFQFCFVVALVQANAASPADSEGSAPGDISFSQRTQGT